jgi:NAD(P)H dehydrogenase (quinone)
MVATRRAWERRVTTTGLPVSVVVVYDSGSRGNPGLRGRTEIVAREVGAGAASASGTDVALVSVAERQRPWQQLDAADAIVFGCPTYMGSASAAIKAFMEESLRPQWVEQRWRDKLAAGFTNSAGMSGDKLLTLHQLAGFAAQHGMVWISLGQLPGWQDSLGSADDANRLAAFLGLMTQSNSDQGPNEVPPASDRETARRFGERIALAARRWRAGAGQASGAADIVLDAFAAVERRDADRLQALYHPDVELHWPPSLIASRPERTWDEIWDPLQPTEHERQMSPRLVASSEHEAVVLWHQRGLSGDGQPFDAEVLGLYEVHDHKFFRAQMFYFDTVAVLRYLKTASPAARTQTDEPA